MDRTQKSTEKDEKVFHIIFENEINELDDLLSTSKSSISRQSQIKEKLTCSSRTQLLKRKFKKLRSETPHIDVSFPLLKDLEYGFLNQKSSTNRNKMILLNAIKEVSLLTYDTSDLSFSLQKRVIDAHEQFFSAAEFMSEHNSSLIALSTFDSNKIALFDIERSKALAEFSARYDPKQESISRLCSGFNTICLGTTEGRVEMIDIRLGESVFFNQLNGPVGSLEVCDKNVLACSLNTLMLFDLRENIIFGNYVENSISVGEGIFTAHFNACKSGKQIMCSQVGAKKPKFFNYNLQKLSSPLKAQTSILCATPSPLTNEVAVLEPHSNYVDLVVNFYSQSSGKMRDSIKMSQDCYQIMYDQTGENLICLGSKSLRIHSTCL